MVVAPIRPDTRAAFAACASAGQFLIDRGRTTACVVDSTPGTRAEPRHPGVEGACGAAGRNPLPSSVVRPSAPRSIYASGRPKYPAAGRRRRTGSGGERYGTTVVVSSEDGPGWDRAGEQLAVGHGCESVGMTLYSYQRDVYVVREAFLSEVSHQSFQMIEIRIQKPATVLYAADSRYRNLVSDAPSRLFGTLSHTRIGTKYLPEPARVTSAVPLSQSAATRGTQLSTAESGGALDVASAIDDSGDR